MASEESPKKGGVTFGDWKLVLLDERNWELYHLRTANKGKDTGKAKWYKTGRYYSYSTLGSAFLYAADYELKSESRDKAVPIAKALEEYERILEEFAGIVRPHMENS